MLLQSIIILLRSNFASLKKNPRLSIHYINQINYYITQVDYYITQIKFQVTLNYQYTTLDYYITQINFCVTYINFYVTQIKFYIILKYYNTTYYRYYKSMQITIFLVQNLIKIHINILYSIKDQNFIITCNFISRYLDMYLSGYNLS